MRVPRRAQSARLPPQPEVVLPRPAAATGAARGLCVRDRRGGRVVDAAAIRMLPSAQVWDQVLVREPCLKLPPIASNAMQIMLAQQRYCLPARFRLLFPL